MNEQKNESPSKDKNLTKRIKKLKDVSEVKASCCSLDDWKERIDRLYGFKEANSFYETLRVVSNPIRLKILIILLDRNWACNCEFEYVLDIHQTLISHHLKIMREAKMISFVKDGLWKYYRIEDEFRPFLENFRELLFTAPKKS